MEINEIYKCEVCGNVVEVVQFATGTLSCCGKEMVKQIANTKEAATEKHIPVVEEKDGGYLVKVGSVEHPMLDEHHIQWVYLRTETDGQISMEERMGCGFGACMGCSVRTKTGWKRICREGPVLGKEEILWEG